MKIGISAIHVRPGKSGSHEPYLVNLVNALSSLDFPHEITLFATTFNHHLFEKARDRMDFVVYPKFTEGVLARIILEQLWLPIDAQWRGIEVMHYPGSSSSFLVGKHDVVTVHQDPESHAASMSRMKQYYFKLVLRRFVGRAARIIAPSESYGHQLVHYFGYKPDQVVSVHHGVNPIFRDVPIARIERARAEFGLEPNAILTVTNTYPHKNIPNLIRAYDLLLEGGFDNQLVIVGDVNEDRLHLVIAQNAKKPERVLNRVRVIQFLPHENLPPIYAAASVFVFFSRVETFGMPLVEAMACGLPVIASDIPVHREILGQAGILISPDAPDGLARALSKMLSEKGSLAQYRSFSLDRSRDFSWRRTAEQTLATYEEAWRFKQ